MCRESRSKLIKNIVTLLMASSLILLVSGCAGSSQESQPQEVKEVSLRFSGISSTDSASASSAYEMTMNEISTASGLEVTFFESTSYSTAVQGLISGHLDIAALDANNFVRALDSVPDLQPIAAFGRSPSSPPGYYPVAVASNDSEISSMSDLAGSKICSADETGTAGYIWPMMELNRLGLAAGTDTSKSEISFIFTGNPLNSAIGVVGGDCDVAWVVDSTWNKRIPDSTVISQEELKIIWEGTLIPGMVLVASADMSSDLVALITDRLLEFGNLDSLKDRGICEPGVDPECIFYSSSNWGFVEAKMEPYLEVREACRVLDLDYCEND